MNEQTFRGSCLCRSVQYELSGVPVRFYHCHCSRCRKSSGTGHASNLFLKPGSIKWIAGKELVRLYKVPEAKRFTRVFCSACGSPVPRYSQELEGVIIPAGSLDTDTVIRPQARIFWDSRASWSCHGDDVPVYSESPTKPA